MTVPSSDFSSYLKRWLAKRAKRVGEFAQYWGDEVDFDMDALVEQYRSRGITIGRNPALWNVTFDPVYPELISLGDRVTITNSTILTHDDSSVLSVGQRRVAPVIIGSDVFIGWQSLILPGVTIGSNSIVGAGSVVTKRVPDNSIVAGVPARIVSSMLEREQKLKSDPSLIDYALCSNRISDLEHDCMKRIIRERYRERVA